MEWISVKDRLPEEQTPVLCYINSIHYPAYGFKTGNNFVIYFIDGAVVMHLTEIISWMPLPEPPKE
jgi:hypothetical protein